MKKTRYRPRASFKKFFKWPDGGFFAVTLSKDKKRIRVWHRDSPKLKSCRNDEVYKSSTVRKLVRGEWRLYNSGWYGDRYGIDDGSQYGAFYSTGIEQIISRQRVAVRVLRYLKLSF